MEELEKENNQNQRKEDGRNSVFYGFTILALVVAFGLGTLTGYAVKGNDTVLQEEVIKTESPAISYKFYLGNDEGLVTVYRTSNAEVYEYTNIVMENLPKDLQKEIQEKKYIVNEEELYNFLESYTS